MTDTNVVPTNPKRQPIVQMRDGAVFASSLDVASYFGKDHKNVLRAIRNLHCSAEFRRANFEPFEINDLTGTSTSHVDMTKDGFGFLTMGFTGAEAGAFKESYITRFNLMEAELRSRPAVDPMVALNDPAAMRIILLSYTEKVLQLEAEKAELTPKADALDRIATADGSLNITEAAKALQVRPKVLFDYLKAHGWIYKRTGSPNWLGYQNRTSAGDLEHKVGTVLRADGSEKITEQVRMTPKGLAKLSKLITGRPHIVPPAQEEAA